MDVTGEGIAVVFHQEARDAASVGDLLEQYKGLRAEDIFQSKWPYQWLQEPGLEKEQCEGSVVGQVVGCTSLRSRDVPQWACLSQRSWAVV